MFQTLIQVTFFQVCLVEYHLVAQVECFSSFNHSCLYSNFAEHAQIGRICLVWSCNGHVMVMCTKMAMFLGSSKVMNFFRVKINQLFTMIHKTFL